MNRRRGRCESPPRENILRIWKAALDRNQMRHNNREFVEYIWLRRICHHFELLGLDPHHYQTSRCNSVSTQTDMEELRNVTIDSEQPEADPSPGSGATSPKSPLRYMSVFSFLDAIRLHKSVEEIERHRRGPARPTKRAVSPVPSNTVKSTLTASESRHPENKLTTSSDRLAVSDACNPLNSLSITTDNNKESTRSSGIEYNSASSVSAASSRTNIFSNASQISSGTLLPQNMFRDTPVIPKETRTSEYTYTYSYSDALKYAIMYGHLEYTEYLLENHLENALLETVCCPLLLVAVRLGHPDIVRQLCSHSRRKTSHNFYINKHGCSAMEGGRTALHVAAEMGNVAILQILLKYGADAGAKDDHGHTPLGRVLYRLQAPHITNKTIRCINEMLKCQMSVSAGELTAISRIILEAAPTVTDIEKPIIAQLLDLVPGPLSLKYVTRSAVRNVISYPKLPEGLHGMNLPNSLRRFLELDE